jgi:DNA-binding transcriptional LysR family regulator
MSPSKRRRDILAALIGCAGLVVAGYAHAQEPAAPTASDWAAMKRVIGDQIAALRKGDAERAFSYAAEGIREQVGSADAFMAMVQSGYGALLTARYTEFLEGAVIEGTVIQPLRLVAPDNSVRVALYTMQRDGARWRIAGCVIAPSTVRAA